jgi:hypothetical protein
LCKWSVPHKLTCGIMRLAAAQAWLWTQAIPPEAGEKAGLMGA